MLDTFGILLASTLPCANLGSRCTVLKGQYPWGGHPHGYSPRCHLLMHHLRTLAPLRCIFFFDVFFFTLLFDWCFQLFLYGSLSGRTPGLEPFRGERRTPPGMEPLWVMTRGHPPHHPQASGLYTFHVLPLAWGHAHPFVGGRCLPGSAPGFYMGLTVH